MKTEDQAWRDLRAHASAQLRTGFADRTLRAAIGPTKAEWRQLNAHAAVQLRPGFASRVLRLARVAADVPSLSSQFALSAATAAVCLAAVVLIQDRGTQLADERNLADWERIVLVAQDAQDFDSI
jgi:negative regulator of sigma E activity